MNAFTTSAARRATCLMLTLTALTFISASVSSARAQAQGVSTRFPTPAQVTADYPDDAQRSAAFSLLFEALNQAAPKPMSKADYERDFNYQASVNALVSLHKMKDGAGSQAFGSFTIRCNQIVSDPNFAQSLLDKYHLNGMPTYPHQAIAGPAASPDDEMKYDVPTQFPKAIPYMLMGVVPMTLAAWLVLRRSGIGRKLFPVPASVAGGLPPLPKSLQVVSLPGVRYATYVLSGRVLDVQTSSHSSSHTHTTGGNTYQSPSGQVHTTPIQSWTSTTHTRETVIWVHTPDNREMSWTLFNTPSLCRTGQIISILVRPLRSGEGEILLAYNHTAGTLERCPALNQSHEPRGNELGQWAANIAGGLTAAAGLNMFLPMYERPGSLDPGFIVAWLFATFVLITISFFILTPLVKSLILKKRNARFTRNYLPGFRQFFERGTAVLQSSLRPL